MPDKRELDEIEIDTNAPKPLNKKQKRLLKKGKIDEPLPEDVLAQKKPLARSPYAVWIGNLSFDTTTEGLRTFIIESTKDLSTPILAEDITRIKLPHRKGFAYVDVKREDQMAELIKLSESRLDNRNILVKNASSFEGRPEEHANGNKNPPTRILFVGNLSFDTTDEQLEMQFQHCGEIRRIRTATFQDTNKCKGFSFIDFKTVEGAEAAMKDPSCRRMNGRSLRMEFGEDRSNRRPKNVDAKPADAKPADVKPVDQTESRAKDSRPAERPPRSDPRKERRGKARPTPGAALSGALRAKTSVVPSTGKKISFD